MELTSKQTESNPYLRYFCNTENPAYIEKWLKQYLPMLKNATVEKELELIK